MTADVIRMVDSREGEQTGRFRWYETFSDYRVRDTETGETRHMGDGVNMFVPFDDDEEGLAHMPGTQMFYDALNAYFENEQAEVAKAYFNIDYTEERKEGSDA